jgi:chromosome segregation ATPase
MLSEAQTSARESKSQLSAVEAENSKLRQQLTTSNKDLEERTQQLLLFQRSIGVLPQKSSSSDDWNALKTQTLQNVDLAKRLEDATIALQVIEEAKAALERRLQNSSNWNDDSDHPSRSQWRTINDVAKARSREPSPLRAFPSRLRERTGSVSSFVSVVRSETDSNMSDDFAQRKNTQNLKNEIEDLTTRLELSEMQRRRLESRAPTHSHQSSTDVEAVELRRLQRENARLHELVDEQAEKMTSSEASKTRTLKDAHPSHQMLENIKSLEQNKQKLTEQQNATLRELTKCRAELDKVLASGQNTDRQIKSLKQKLDAEQSARQEEQKSHQQSMIELKNLKIRLEKTSGQFAEFEDTIKMYKSRSEDLQNKLEDAEIAAHNAMRSESYARGQLQEVEDALAAALDEQRKAEDSIISLQKELRTLEGKVLPSTCTSKNSLRITLPS